MGTKAWLAVLLLCAGVAQADEWEVYPPQGTLPFLGLDDTSAPTQAQDGRASDLQNVKLGISRDLRQRDGYSTIGNSQDAYEEVNCAITGLYYAKFSSGTERIVSTCGTRFNYLNGATWTTVTGITVVQTAGQDNQFVFTTALDNIIATNGVNGPLRFDGTNLTTVDFTSLSSTDRIQAARTVSFFKNFLIFGGTTENTVYYPTRIRWSNVGSISRYSDNDSIDIDALQGQEITAMGILYDNLYVFLTDSIYRVSFVAGADTFNVSKVTDDIGCIAKNSVQSITLSNAQNGLVFLDKDKRVYFLDGITVRDISPMIQTTMSALNASRLRYAVSADSNTDYYLCVTSSTGTENNLCLDLQYQIGEWTKYTNVPANAMAHVVDANGRDQVYFGSYESFVYQLEDDDLMDDVGSFVSTIRRNQVDFMDAPTASGLLTFYFPNQSFAVGAFMGAPFTVTGGTVTGQTTTVQWNTTTAILVADTLNTITSDLTHFQIGAIDSFYTSKWYDLGQPARLKHYGEVYFWAGEEDSKLDISYATDLNTDIATEAISLSAGDNDAVWGSAVWGTSLWGSDADVFRQVKLDSQGRYVRVKFDEDDPAETFHLYNWSILSQFGDVN